MDFLRLSFQDLVSPFHAQHQRRGPHVRRIASDGSIKEARGRRRPEVQGLGVKRLVGST